MVALADLGPGSNRNCLEVFSQLTKIYNRGFC